MIIELFGIEVNWPSQILGVIGCALCIYSFFLNSKSKFLLFVSIGFIFCIGECVLLLFTGSNTYGNIAATVIAIIRNAVTYAFLKKKDKEPPIYFTFIFTALVWLGSIPFYDEWYTFIPPVAQTISTVVLFFKNFIVTKAGNIVYEILYLTYNVSIGAYSGIIRDGFGLVSAIVSIVLFALYLKKKKQEPPLEEIK